jgi:hypothetical protein
MQVWATEIFKGANVMRKVLLAFAVLGLALASAKTYGVKLFQKTYIGGQELQPGEYKIDVENDKAVMQRGKVRAEAPVKVETNGHKYGTTTVRLANVDGKLTMQEIRLGGTNTRLIFSE